MTSTKTIHPCWQLLGIAPTSDDREIKRTYARLLKQCRPDDDAEGFKALREAFEEAMWQASEMQNAATEVAEPAPPEAGSREAQVENMLRPHVEALADLNETGTSEETLQTFERILDQLELRDANQRDALVWEMFEDGMIWVCCEINANHDEFLRRCIDLFGWLTPGHWLNEKDPKTVTWLQLRLEESTALAEIDQLMDLLEAGGEAAAIERLNQLAEHDMLINLDVRHLFEAELMVSLSALESAAKLLVAHSISLFGWKRDHRHLEEYHPEAWLLFCKKYSYQPH